MSNELQVTSGAEWRKPWEEGVVVRLPSGNVARLRDVTLELMVLRGGIPDGMTPIVSKIFEGKANELPGFQTVDEMRDYIELRDNICRVAFVNPRIVDEPTADDEIHIDALDQQDKWFVYGLLNAPVRELERFRDEQKRAVDALVSTEGHGEASERDSESANVGENEIPS